MSNPVLETRTVKTHARMAIKLSSSKLCKTAIRAKGVKLADTFLKNNILVVLKDRETGEWLHEEATVYSRVAFKKLYSSSPEVVTSEFVEVHPL